MAKVEEPYRISGQQLVDTRSDRPIIDCPLSMKIGLSGGIQMGSTVVIGGKPGCGKTTVSLQCAANAQNQFGSKVFFFPIEGRLTQQVFKQIKGIKLDAKNFEVILPPPIEKQGKVIGHKKWHAQQWWTEIGRTIQENPESIIIVDSIANLSTEKEQSEGMGYFPRGSAQAIEAQFCRIYGDLIIPSGVTLFLLTHVQANVSGYGPLLQLKVGNHIRHQADILLFAKSVEKWKEQDGRIRGHDIIFSVEKSGMGQSSLEFRLPLRYSVGIDDIQDVFNHAVTWGIIKRKGAWYSLPFIESDGKFLYIDESEDVGKNEENLIKASGEQGAWKWLADHKKETKLLNKIMLDKLLIS